SATPTPWAVPSVTGDAKVGEPPAVAVVLTSAEMADVCRGETPNSLSKRTRSGLPSPFKSPIATDGAPLTHVDPEKVTPGANDVIAALASVVLMNAVAVTLAP